MKLFIIYLITFFLFSTHANSQIITLAAGLSSSGSGYNGDGIPATSARLYWPNQVAVDDHKNFYIADTWNNRVRKVDSLGIITTIAGDSAQGYSGDGGLAIHASLDMPAGVAVNTSGEIFIADAMHIRKVDASGIISTVANTSGHGIYLDLSGNLFIAAEHLIKKLSVSGVLTTIAGNGTSIYSGDGGPATSAGIPYPLAVAVDASGNIFIADEMNNVVRKINTSGIISLYAGDGFPGHIGNGVPATSAELSSPHGLCTDNSGNVYIADADNFLIRKVSTSGIITTVAGNGTFFYSDSVPATSAGLYMPYDVKIDNMGNMFIVNFMDNQVRKVSASGDHPTTSNTIAEKNTRISVYPNPFTDQVTITGMNKFDKLTICDVMGRQIFNFSNLNNDKFASFNLDKISKGVYFLKITGIEDDNIILEILKD